MRPLSFVPRILAALVAAAIALAATMGFALINEFVTTGSATFPRTLGKGLALTVAVYLIVCLPTASALVVLDWVLATLKRTTAMAYAATGVATGATAETLFVLVQSARRGDFSFSPPNSFSLFLYQLGVMALYGGIGGLAFWWLARRGRGKPFWSDVF